MSRRGGGVSDFVELNAGESRVPDAAVIEDGRVNGDDWDSESEISASDFPEFGLVDSDNGSEDESEVVARRYKALYDSASVEDAESHVPSEEENSKEEEIAVPLDPFSKTRTRNFRSRKSRKAARRCYTLLKDMNFLPSTSKSECKCGNHGHGCSEAGLSPEAFPPLVKGGTGPNREECHPMTHGLIGKGHSPEPRTEGVGISKAALARESHRLTEEAGGKTCPVDDYSRELQRILDDKEALTFEGREKLREQWCMVHGSLPEELCRSREDVKEMLTRMANSQSLLEPVGKNGKSVKHVRFEGGDGEKTEVKVLDPLYKPSDMSLSPLGEKGSVDGWV